MFNLLRQVKSSHSEFVTIMQIKVEQLTELAGSRAFLRGVRQRPLHGKHCPSLRAAVGGQFTSVDPYDRSNERKAKSMSSRPSSFDTTLEKILGDFRVEPRAV